MPLAFLGTGLMRLVNIGLILVLIGTALFAGYKAWTGGIREEGRQEVRQQIEDQNQKLDIHVRTVNEGITRRVIVTDEIIRRQSQDVEDVINAQPSETLSNVSAARLDRVREQQSGTLREAGGKSNGPNPELPCGTASTPPCG